MKRREALALLGSAAALGVAGCAGGSDDGGADAGTGTDSPTPTTANPTGTPTDTATPTETPAGTVEPTPTYDPAVSLDSLQRGVLELRTDAIAVIDRAGQYLYLDVSVEGEPVPAADEFAFQFDGDTHEPITRETPVLWRDYNHDGGYSKSTGEGWLLFALPAAGDASNARLTWGFGNEGWRPDRTLRDRLAATPPEMSVTASIPEAVTEGEAPTVSVTATNESDLPGRLIGGLNRRGPLTTIRPVASMSLWVPPGESRTWEHADEGLVYREPETYDDGEPDMSYEVSLPGEDLGGEVRITSS